VVQRLSDDGYLRRVPHPDDRRSTLASITPTGSRTARAPPARPPAQSPARPGRRAGSLPMLRQRSRGLCPDRCEGGHAVTSRRDGYRPQRLSGR
jgi:hypothetical protein